MFGEIFSPAVNWTSRAAGTSSKYHWYAPVRFDTKMAFSAPSPTNAQDVKYRCTLLDPSPVNPGTARWHEVSPRRVAASDVETSARA